MRYYVLLDGEQQGPLHIDLIETMVKDGKITGKTLVWARGMTDWEEAGKVGDLAALFAPDSSATEKTQTETDAKRPKDYKHSLQIPPLMLIWMALSNNDTHRLIAMDIGYQLKLSPKITLFINPGIRFSTNIGDYADLQDYTVTIGPLFRPGASGLRGLYLGLLPIAGYTAGTYSRTNRADPNNAAAGTTTVTEAQQYFNIGLAAEAGYEWIFGSGFTGTVGLGIAKVFAIPLGDYRYPSEAPGGSLYGGALAGLPIDLRLRAMIGFSF
jgi:hypothetical protein